MNLATIYLTDVCNFNCSYCVASRWNKRGTDTSHLLSASLLLDYLQKFLPAEDWKIEITGGGEPALHPQITQIVLGLTELCYSGIIRTNGSLPIPKTPAFKLITTWHRKEVPLYYDYMLIMKNHKEDWRAKERYCLENRIPYETVVLKNYCVPKDLSVNSPPLRTLGKIIKRTTIFSTGVLSGCNKDKRIENGVQRMSSPIVRVPCGACPATVNAEMFL